MLVGVEATGAVGLETLASLPDRLVPALVFVVEPGSWMAQSLAESEVHHLPAPVDESRLRQVLEVVNKELVAPVNGHRQGALNVLRSAARPTAQLGFLVVRGRGHIDLLRIDDIDWVEAAANYVRIHVGSEVHRMRSTLAAVKSRLDPARFLPIHRCIIVNVERVKQIRPSLQGSWTVILRDGTRLNLSRSFRPRVERFLDDLAVGQARRRDSLSLQDC
jgi:two-component system LytT family response regulator